MKLLALLILGLAPATVLLRGADPTTVLFQEGFENGLSKSWKDLPFEGETKYEIVHEGTNAVLRARARSSASGLIREVNVPSTPRVIFRWRWKIEKVPEGGTETDMKSFDHAVRLFVAFRSGLGPPRTINYVWSNQFEINTTFHHPRSSRSRFMVLERGNQQAGRWITETRDITADWKRLFQEKMPARIQAIGLMTDSDGTRTEIDGFYDDLSLFTRP